MSNRTVAVVLKAQVDNYLQNMDAARRHTTDVEKAARSATEQLRIHQEALTRVGVGMTAVGAAAAVGLGVAIKASAEFGSKMAQLQSLSHATAAQMQQVSEAAMTQGKAFGYNATQVADAQIELQKAGIGIQEQLGGALQGALTLAAAGQIDVADATSIAVQAMTQFGLSAKDVPHIADQIASAADSSVGSVDSIGQSLNQAGLVANQFGWSLEETVGTLTAFSQAGLNGSDGGTSLKTALLALATPTKQQSEAMKTLGIDVFDASGHFVSAAGLADQLQKGLGKVDDESRLAALGIIFGSDAARAAGVAYSQGAAGIQKYIDGNDRAGFASAQAAGKLNSLEGDAKKLSAAFENDLIRAGGSVDGALRSITQTATALVEIFGEIPQPVLAVGVGLTALVAGVGLVGGAALIAVPKVTAFRATLDELGISGKRAAGFIGKGGALLAGIGLVGAAIASTAQHGVADAQQIALAGERIEDGWKGLDTVFDRGGFATGLYDLKTTISSLSAPLGAGAAAKSLDAITAGITHFSDAAKSSEGDLDAMGQQLAALAQQDYGRAAASFASLVEQYHLGQDEAGNLLKLMGPYRDELIKQAQAAGVSASDHNLLQLAQRKGAVSAKVLAAQQETAAAAAEKQAAQIASLGGEAQSADVDIQQLSDTIAGFGNATLDARAAQRDFRQAVKDARAAVADSSKTDDEKQASLDGIARAGIASAASLAKLPGGAEKARRAMQAAREDFIDVAAKMLGSRSAAKKLADQLGLIPSNVPVAVSVSGTGKAQDQVAALKRALEDLDGFRATVEVAARVAGAPNAAQVARNAVGNLRGGMADGGPVNGSGPKGVDSVYAILAPGEHVLTASEVDRMGGQSAVSAFRADLMGQVQAYAKGGPVGGIDQQKAAAEKAQRDADDYQRRVVAQKNRSEAAAKSAEMAQNRYDDIDGTKKNRAAKKAAKDAAERARKTADAEEKRVEDLREKRDKAREKAKDASEAAAQLRLDREDFVSAERRNPDRVSTDPLAYVDQLRQMSRDENYSTADRKKFKEQANEYERSLARMTEESKKAAETLSTLQESAKQLHDSVASAVTGGYGLSGYASAQAAMTTTSDTGWFERNGIRFQSSSSTTGAPLSASGIAGYYAAGAAQSNQFADALQQLAGRGLNTSLLAELAQMGTAQGLPIAQAILAGSDSDLGAINGGYAGLAAAGNRAGSIVSDATYAKQIADADAHLQQINQTLTEDGQKLRHLIATAFGLPGYALGTSAATEGLHWVGEHGPELVGLRAGTPVATAADSARWVRGGAPVGGATQVTVQAPQVRFPDTLLLQDGHGFEAQFRVIAQQEIHADAAQDAVLMMGTGTL